MEDEAPEKAAPKCLPRWALSFLSQVCVVGGILPNLREGGRGAGGLNCWKWNRTT